MKTKKLIIMIAILSIGYVSNVYACDPVPVASPSPTASPVASETPWLSIQL